MSVSVKLRNIKSRYDYITCVYDIMLVLEFKTVLLNFNKKYFFSVDIELQFVRRIFLPSFQVSKSIFIIIF